MRIKNEEMGLYGKLNAEEREKLCMSGKWDRAVSGFVEKGVVQLINEVVQVLSTNEDMLQDMEAFRTPDYESAVLNSDFVVVESASNRYHFFDASDLSSVEVDQGTGACVIDFQAFAKDHGIDLNDWRFDVHSMSVVPAKGASAVSAPESDVIAGFVHHSAYAPSLQEREINGKDVIDNVIAPIFSQVGKSDIAEKLLTEPWQLLGETERGEYRYLNRDFDSISQKFDGYDEVCRHICEEYGIDAKSPEIFQYFLVKDWFAELLKEEGMRIAEVAGLTVWGRESFGMSISMEAYAQRMFAKDCTNSADELIHEILPEAVQRLIAEQEKPAVKEMAGVTLG